ncbi:MAG: hypothetical protein HY890_01445 [Deltaproteobacteria bacterium]|nr:hypothetical protein [Deltaproteobacteria bacterium]
MRVKMVFVPLLILFAFLIFLPYRADAVPAFARQTGFACNTCHFQHFPSLNQFGRSFKAGGYTMVGGQSLVEGDFLSLPAVLNATLVTKIRYQKTNGKNELAEETNRGQVQFPDEGSLLIAGRAGEHIGFLLEAQIINPDASAFASFKMPFVYDVQDTKLSVIPFLTDAAGPSYGFELLNTGALRMQRPLEHRHDTSAQQYIGTAREATGIAFVASRDIGYLNFTLWSPEFQTTDAKPYLHYLRAALTPTVAGWDTGFGVQIWGGKTKFSEASTITMACVDDGATPVAPCDGPGGPIAMGDIVEITSTAFTRVAAEAWAVDAQAQGNIGWMPVGVYLSYGVSAKSGSTVPNLFNSSTADRRKAFTATAEFGVIPSRLTLAAAMRNADSGAATNSKADSVTVGATYLVTQNVQLQTNYTWYNYDMNPDAGDRLLTLMLFAAF